MTSPRCPECNRENSYTYFVTVPGGDSLLCKPYRREQFYQLGYSSSSCSSCSSVQPVYCRETIKTLSAIVYEESDSCTCHIPACFTCPRHDQLTQIFSDVSCTQCDPYSCLWDQPKKPKPHGDICRLAELVDVASSVTDLLKKLKEPKCKCEGVSKKCKGKRKHKCECTPIQNICLKTVVNKSSCGECLEEEVISLASCRYDEEMLTCVTPCKRKLKFDVEPTICTDRREVCQGNARKDVNINLFVNVKKEEECPKIQQIRKCKCKSKKKREDVKRICKCDISPAMVICDKKPERHKTFLQAIKAIIPNTSKNGKEQATKCACKKAMRNSKIYSLTICRDDKEDQKNDRKSSNVKEHPLNHDNDNEKSEKRKSRHSHRSSNRHIEHSTNTEDHTDKPLPSKGHEVIRSVAKLEIETTNASHDHHDKTTNPEMETNASKNLHTKNRDTAPKAVHRPSRNTSDLNTLFINNRGSTSFRSVLMEPEPKTVQYMFVQTYERFPFKVHCNGLEKVSYRIKLRYKSILWLDLANPDDVLKFKKPSTHTIRAEWKPLETSTSPTEMNTNDKFSQVAGILEQYQENDKNFLSIVKKFEEYKNQQRLLEELRWSMSDNRHEGKAGDFFARRVKRKVFFSRIKSDYLCRIFCEYIGPLIYLFYLVVFFWVTF